MTVVELDGCGTHQDKNIHYGYKDRIPHCVE